jgi:hypothetical protein
MKVEIYKLQDNKSGVCLIDKKTYDALKISEATPYKLHLGQLTAICHFKPSLQRNNSIYISEDILDQILLYENIILNIWKKNNDIYLGPVVGMFVTRQVFNSCTEGKPVITLIEHIQEAAPSSNCLGYCFCADNVDFENKKIKGYTFIPSLNQWQHGFFPIPDVIYDRAAYLEKEEKELAKEIRDEFNINPKIRFINPIGSLGKWPLYKSLSKYPEIKSYLPYTILYNTFDDILSMLNKCNFIFLKSSYGSRGKEVLCIEKTNNQYRVDFFNNELKLVYAQDVLELKRYIEDFINDKKTSGRQTFIIQQGIKLIKYNGHNIDFRIDIVKNEDGKWEPSRSYGIYASGNSKITNFCVGGMQEHFKDIYPKLIAMHKNIDFPTEETIMAAIEKIATFIEKSFGPHGEIGIDIALDGTGKLWFIEGNAKPDKSRIPGFDDMNGIAPQALAIFKYAKYLAKNIK